jgi:hypothetical protein
MLLRLRQKELLHNKHLGGIAVCASSAFPIENNAADDVDGKQIETYKRKTPISQFLHKHKVKIIQQQIRKGKYRLEDKLDAAIDRIIEEIFENNK